MTMILPSLDQRSRLPLARIACVGLILQSLTACDQARDAIGEGEIFPLQSLQTLPLLTDARPDLSGKTLLINFWATWCAPCRAEMPYLQRLSDRLDPARFAVIGVAVDDDTNLVREFMLQYRIRFANFQDISAKLAANQLGIVSYPQTFIVSPQGVILRRIDEAIPQDWNPFEKARNSGSEKHAARPQTELDG